MGELATRELNDNKVERATGSVIISLNKINRQLQSKNK